MGKKEIEVYSREIEIEREREIEIERERERSVVTEQVNLVVWNSDPVNIHNSILGASLLVRVGGV